MNILNPKQTKEIENYLQTLTTKTQKNNKGVIYYNFASSFDIETSSFYRDLDNNNIYNNDNAKKLLHVKQLEKVALMYIWQLSINEIIIIGRTWYEFLDVLNLVKKVLNLPRKRLIIYVHNLSYEFQFFRKWLKWDKVFATDERCVLYGLSNGFEFRCSYLLSGYNLDNLAKQLTNHQIKKMVGNLNYDLIRHSQTPLSDREIEYCVNDVIIINYYITEYIENVKGIINIPLTKTGAVRKHARKICFDNLAYKDLICDLQIEPEEFEMVQNAFCGGFTHANANYVDYIIDNVASYDFTSAYPYIMVAEKFPMSKGLKVDVKNKEHFDHLLENYFCIFDVIFYDLIASIEYENYLSSSKCKTIDCVENNGRIVCAKECITTVTNIDYTIIKNVYNWSKANVGKMYIYKKDYLPKCFINCVLDLYEQKTQLKGVKGSEVEYLQSKEMLNSLYGMTVTSPLKDDIIYNNDNWSVRELTDKEKNERLFKYNLSKNRFLFYLWGVFVTAHARRNLWTAIYTIGNDYIYSDTDSVKFRNADKYKSYFNMYNKRVCEKLQKVCNYYNIDIKKVMPKTKEGKIKILGVWDYEGTYKQFKTLGAKRYAYQNADLTYNMTVSGVNKKYAIPYLYKKYKDDLLDHFTNYLCIPAVATGKKILTYIDYEQTGEVTDYNGVKCTFNEKSAVHMDKSDYNLSLSQQYINYLLNIKLIKQ